jgi:hypothetical protein
MCLSPGLRRLPPRAGYLYVRALPYCVTECKQHPAKPPFHIIRQRAEVCVFYQIGTRITLNFSDAQLEQLNKILNYLEARASAGASSQADLERARTRVLNARQTRIEQQTNYRNAMFELDRLTGIMPTTLQLPFLQLLPALPDNHGQIRQYVKDQNFDLLALRKDINAQRSTVTGEYSKSVSCVAITCVEHV